MAQKPKKQPKKVFGREAERVTANIVRKAKRGEGTLRYTPKKKKGGY